jgi:hypothetical protein
MDFVEINHEPTRKVASVLRKLTKIGFVDGPAVNGVKIDWLGTTRHATLDETEQTFLLVSNVEVSAGRTSPTSSQCFMVKVRAHETLNECLGTRGLARTGLAANECVHTARIQPELIREMGFEVRAADKLG